MIKLRVSNAPVEHILVFGAKPCNAGREYCDKFVYLGRLGAAEGGERDISEQYVKQFGEPAAGKKVMIGTLQQVNGWRDVHKRSLKRTEAIVPGQAGEASAGCRGEGAGRPGGGGRNAEYGMRNTAPRRLEGG
jgi:hypothetical protein